MLAYTVLYTLSGGWDADTQPLDFVALMKATKARFDDERLYDQIKAGKAELIDLLCAMLDR